MDFARLSVAIAFPIFLFETAGPGWSHMPLPVLLFVPVVSGALAYGFMTLLGRSVMRWRQRA